MPGGAAWAVRFIELNTRGQILLIFPSPSVDDPDYSEVGGSERALPAVIVAIAKRALAVWLIIVEPGRVPIVVVRYRRLGSKWRR